MRKMSRKETKKHAKKERTMKNKTEKNVKDNEKIRTYEIHREK